jgi:membrane protease subunit HflK
MAWNEPGGSKDKDPWGNRGNDQGPPDLDEVVRKMQDKLGGLFGGKKGKGGGDAGGTGPSGGSVKGTGAIALVALVAWLAYDMAYIIQPAERGVVLRFGQYVDTMQPGLNFRLPQPIESVSRVDVDRNRNVLIGYRSGTEGRSTKSTPVPSEALMLTRDENIVDVRFAIQYNIKSARDYLFNVKNPDLSLREATESAVREAVGKSDMDFVLKEGRSDIVDSVKTLVQNILDNYGTGLMIISVNMQDAQPPEQVQHAFDDAVKAREDQQRLINEAEAYSNDILPKARGGAARQIEEGSAYKEQVVAKAEGEAERFERILAEYKKAPGVTRQRLYLETIEEVLGNTSKVMIDVEGGNNLLYLPLDRLGQEGASLPGVNAPSFEAQTSAAAQRLIQRESESMRSRERR